jgi:hypothetical protein
VSSQYPFAIAWSPKSRNYYSVTRVALRNSARVNLWELPESTGATFNSCALPLVSAALRMCFCLVHIPGDISIKLCADPEFYRR